MKVGSDGREGDGYDNGVKGGEEDGEAEGEGENDQAFAAAGDGLGRA